MAAKSEGKEAICRPFARRACLSGKDIAELIEGRVVTAFGTEFAYDGTEAGRVAEAVQFLAKREPAARPREQR
jgi:hypothetical protein